MIFPDVSSNLFGDDDAASIPVPKEELFSPLTKTEESRMKKTGADDNDTNGVLRLRHGVGKRGPQDYCFCMPGDFGAKCSIRPMEERNCFCESTLVASTTCLQKQVKFNDGLTKS